MHRTVRLSRTSAIHFLLGAVVFAATAFSTNAAFNARLQGQSRGSTVWLDGNLQGWRDLDVIPCRVYLTGGPANNKVITVEFEYQNVGDLTQKVNGRRAKLDLGESVFFTVGVNFSF